MEGDLSSVHNIAEFAAEVRRVAAECMRVLMSFLDAGFILREDIIKLQWKTKSTREKWFGKKYDFYLIAHEHLYIFRKLDRDERTTKFRESMKWW